MNRWLRQRVITEPSPDVEHERVPPPESPRVSAPPPAPRPGRSWWRRRWPWVIAASAAALLLALFSLRGGRGANDSATGEAALPTATVERRDFIRSVRIHGTVEAVQSHSVAAPRLAGQPGGAMIITSLASPGSMVKPGGLLVDFDRQNQVKNAHDRRAEYLDFEEQIKRRRAEQDAALARDLTELKQAENAVTTASLEMRRNEVISRIDAEKNQQNLEEARARLVQLKETFDLKRTAAQASIRTLEIQRDRSRNAALHAERNAEKMSIRSRLAGMVVLNQIGRPSGIGEVQEGDEVWPGNPFMQVVDPSRMQVRARVNQADISMLRIGQPVAVRLDAYPDLRFPGRVESVAAIGIASGMNPKVRSFMAVISIVGSDPKLLPDLSAALDLELQRIPGVLVAPRDAVWTENGQSWVRVRNGSGLEDRQVQTGAVSDHEIVIESGVDAGAVVVRGATRSAR